MSGIFCLEGEWDHDIEARDSVLPILELLHRLDRAEFVHRDVVTRQEFDYYLEKFNATAPARFPVLYLAAHGELDRISLGRDDVLLTDIEKQLHGSLAGRVLYFGSCLVGLAEDDDLKSFAKATGARAIVGYEAEVDWLESASFDPLLLARLVQGWRSDALFRYLLKDNRTLAIGLGLVVAIKSTVYRASDLG